MPRHWQRPSPYGGGLDLDRLYESLSRSSFVALDFETTGLSASSERVVEVGAVRFSMHEADADWKLEVADSFHSLVHPGRPIPGEASAVHGIYDLDVAAAPSFGQLASDLFGFLGDSVLLAHNAGFDHSFLRAEAERAGLACPVNPVYDSIMVARKARPGLPSYALGKLALSFGIAQSKAHRADDDARVCMEIFARCVRLLYT